MSCCSTVSGTWKRSRTAKTKQPRRNVPSEFTHRCFILCFVPGLKVLLLGIPDGFQENWELCFLALIAGRFWEAEPPHGHFLTNSVPGAGLWVCQPDHSFPFQALAIPSAYSQIFEKGIHGLNRSVNSWIKSWQGSAFPLTVPDVLKPGESTEASPWSHRAPFTLKLSAGFGSSINWEPGHIARVSLFFPAIDETEMIGYSPRDLSFLRLHDFKGRGFFTRSVS